MGRAFKKHDPITKLMEELRYDPRYEDWPVEKVGIHGRVNRTMERWGVTPGFYEFRCVGSRYAVVYNHPAATEVHVEIKFPSAGAVSTYKVSGVTRILALAIQHCLGIRDSDKKISEMFPVAIMLYEISLITGIKQSVLRSMYVDLGGEAMAVMDTPEQYIAAARLAVQEDI